MNYLIDPPEWPSQLVEVSHQVQFSSRCHERPWPCGVGRDLVSLPHRVDLPLRWFWTGLVCLMPAYLQDFIQCLQNPVIQLFPGCPLPLLLQADCYDFRVRLHLGKHLSLALDHNLGASHQLTQVLPGCRVLTMPWCFNRLMAFSFLLHHTYNLFGPGPRCSKLSGSVSLSAEIMHT